MFTDKQLDKELGVYTRADAYSDIVGNYEIPYHAVLWVARWPGPAANYDPASEAFNINSVVELVDEDFIMNTRIGGYLPVIWQFTGTGPSKEYPYPEDCDVTTHDPKVFQPKRRRYSDVPADHWALTWIEKTYETGIMTGCDLYPLRFCPEDPVTRAAVAEFLLKTKYGKDFEPPPASGTVFNDVPVDHPFAGWIEKSYADGLTSECSTDPPLYCPDHPLSRAEAAVFLVHLVHGPAYNPPPPTGKVFQDVPATYWAAKWIEQLHRDDLAAGSSTDPALYRSDDPTTRAEMAVFLGKAEERRPGCILGLLELAKSGLAIFQLLRKGPSRSQG